jgi:hypothetical protein
MTMIIGMRRDLMPSFSIKEVERFGELGCIYSTVITGCQVPEVTSSIEWRMIRSGWIGIPRDYHIDVSEMNGKDKIRRELTWTKWRHPRATRLMRVCKEIRPS